MANNYKSPVQVEPAANTLTSLYTVPADTQAIFSAINVCNTASQACYRVEPPLSMKIVDQPL
jgi:hypothetical protein